MHRLVVFGYAVLVSALFAAAPGPAGAATCLQTQKQCVQKQKKCVQTKKTCAQTSRRCAEQKQQCLARSTKTGQCVSTQTVCARWEDTCSRYQETCAHYEDVCTQWKDVCVKYSNPQACYNACLQTQQSCGNRCGQLRDLIEQNRCVNRAHDAYLQCQDQSNR